MTELKRDTVGKRPVALVTGGRRGIGRGCAYALAEAGFDIVVNDLEHCEAAEETLAGLAGRGVSAKMVIADIGDLDDHERLVADSLSAFGHLDCLVNNAGVSALSRGDLLDMSVESFDRCLNINLRGTFFLTQRIARDMLAESQTEDDPHRSIITISSINTDVIGLTRGEYCMSKSALAMMTKMFALRLAEAGIGVYEVRPGIIRTPMTAVVADRYDREIANGISPIRRWGEPEDVGRTVAVMATGQLPFTVGQSVNVDGGLAWRHF